MLQQGFPSHGVAEEWDPVPLFSVTTTSSGSAAGWLDLGMPLRCDAQGSLRVLPWQRPYMCCILGRRSSCHMSGLKTEM